MFVVKLKQEIRQIDVWQDFILSAKRIKQTQDQREKRNQTGFRAQKLVYKVSESIKQRLGVMKIANASIVDEELNDEDGQHKAFSQIASNLISTIDEINSSLIKVHQ